jgi:hypothetical protein
MSGASEGFVVRSFSGVFALERRLFKVDRWRIPVPYGVPVRGLGYAFAALAALAVLSSLPVLGALIGALPAPVRWLVVPVGCGYALTQIRVDGRCAHAAGAAWARFMLGPRALSGFRPLQGGPWSLGEIVMAADESSPRYRRCRIEGAGRLLFRYPASAVQRRRTLVLEQTSSRPMWSGKRLELKPGQRLVVR